MVLALSIAGCAKETTPPPGTTSTKVYELTFSHMHPTVDNMHKLIMAGWAKQLERDSGGRIKITILPFCQAAPMEGQYDAAKAGTVDIADQVLGCSPGRWSSIGWLDMPFLFDYPASTQTSLTVMSMMEKYPQIQEQFSDVRFLLFHGSDASHIFATDKTIKNMDDWKGTITIVSEEWGSDTVAALGGTPELINPMEQYDALAKGIGEAINMNLSGAVVFNLTDVTKYCTMVGMITGGWMVVMNKDTYNSMPPDLQEYFSEENMLTLAKVFSQKFDQDLIMFEGMIDETFKSRGDPGLYYLPDEERAKWIATTKPIWDKWVSSVEAKGLPGKQMLEDAQKFAKQYKYKAPDPEIEKILQEYEKLTQ